MRPLVTRRCFVRWGLSGFVPVLTGCVDSPEGTPPASPNTRTKTPASSSALSGDFEFVVSVLQEFTPDHPARLTIQLTNRSDTEVSLETSPPGPAPFADFLGERVDGDGSLLLNADDLNGQLEVLDAEGESIPIEEAVVMPTNSSCWRILSHGWARTLLGEQERMGQSDTISHQYTFYFVDSAKNSDGAPTCRSGHYAFEDQVSISTNPEEEKQFTGRFVLTVDEDLEISVTQSAFTVTESE